MFAWSFWWGVSTAHTVLHRSESVQLLGKGYARTWGACSHCKNSNGCSWIWQHSVLLQNKPLLQSLSYIWLLLKCCCCYRRPGIQRILSLLHGESHLSNWMRLKVVISTTMYLLTQKKLPIKFLKIGLREISWSFFIRKNPSAFTTPEMQTF